MVVAPFEITIPETSLPAAIGLVNAKSRPKVLAPYPSPELQKGCACHWGRGGREIWLRAAGEYKPAGSQ